MNQNGEAQRTHKNTLGRGRGRKGYCSLQAVCTLGSEPWAPDTGVVPACSRGCGHGFEQACWGGSSMNWTVRIYTQITPSLMIPRDWVRPGVLLGVRSISWHTLGRPWNHPWHPQLLSTQATPGQSWPGSNKYSLDSSPQGWTKTSLASGEPGWTERCTSVQPITFFTLGVLCLLFGDSISKLAIVTKDEFTNEHSSATKNSGLVYKEGKGGAALLQNTLLRRLIVPDGLHQFHCKTVPL